MPNRTIHKSLKFFTPVEGDGQLFSCKLCGEEKIGKQKTNLTTHLQRRHNRIYQSEIIQKAEDIASLQQLTLLQILTEIIAIDHIPFNALLKPGFQKLLEEKVNRCIKAGAPVNVTDRNLRQLKDHLHNTSDKIKGKIKEEVGNKHVSVSSDIVSKNGRSVLGICIQYILSGVLKVRCIGMIELLQRHTGNYLCELIKARFEEFGWTLSRLVGLTTDNASNMKKLLKTISEQLEVEENSDG